MTQQVSSAESMLMAKSIREYVPNSPAAREVNELIKALQASNR